MSTTSDDLFQAYLAKLKNAADKPAGLDVEPFPVLDIEATNLPYLGMTMAEDDKLVTDGGEWNQGPSVRQCIVMHEIWVRGDNPRSAAKDIRNWVLKTLNQDRTLGNIALRARYDDGSQFAPAYLNGWVGCLVFSISFEYAWSNF